jgi:hypothetical protein
VTSEVPSLTVTALKNRIIWDTTLCGLVQVYRRFRGMYCLRSFGTSTRSQGDIPAPPPNSSFHIQRRENLKFNNCGNNWINCFVSALYSYELFSKFFVFTWFPYHPLFLCGSFNCAVSQVKQHRMTAANNQLETIRICINLINGTIQGFGGKPRKPKFKIL